MELPLVIEKEDDYKGYVKESVRATFGKQGKVSANTKRTMSFVLAQIKETDTELKPYYRFHVSKVLPPEVMKDSGSVRKEMRMVQTELYKMGMLFVGDDQVVPRNLIDTTKTIAKDGFQTEYKKGYMTLVLNPALTEFYIEVSKFFNTIEIDKMLSFKSWYSMRMWEFLSNYSDTGYWDVHIDEYRELMDCTKKYPNTSDMIKKTQKEPEEELKGTSLEYKKELLRVNLRGVGRPSIVGIRFKLKSIELKKIPDSWWQFSEEIRFLLERLMQTWFVSEASIVRYAKAIGKDRIHDLIREWEQKQMSNNKMNNVRNYCNNVWVKEGKKAMAVQSL